MLEWVRIRSWHLTSGVMSRGGMIRTRCGKWAAKDADQSPHLPENQKSCESCFRNKEIRVRE